jgi:hypothetical protein
MPWLRVLLSEDVHERLKGEALRRHWSLARTAVAVLDEVLDEVLPLVVPLTDSGTPLRGSVVRAPVVDEVVSDRPVRDFSKSAQASRGKGKGK